MKTILNDDQKKELTNFILIYSLDVYLSDYLDTRLTKTSLNFARKLKQNTKAFVDKYQRIIKTTTSDEAQRERLETQMQYTSLLFIEIAKSIIEIEKSDQDSFLESFKNLVKIYSND